MGSELASNYVFPDKWILQVYEAKELQAFLFYP